YFADDSDEAFEVDSSTRAKDFCANVISVPEGDFFFDFVRHLTEWNQEGEAQPAGQGPQRRTSSSLPSWKLPKLLRGYHKCTVDEAAELAALDLSRRFLKELLPADLIKQSCLLRNGIRRAF
uniref:AAA_lid_3 domain-containing protein n=1 Tax=Macrostomum lignano TaxID=282301 RepID=A0A1I8FCU5_9PLAT